MKPSKYPTLKSALGADPVTISVPQFDMHPLVPPAAVPGAPVGDFDSVQKSEVVPHCQEKRVSIT